MVLIGRRGFFSAFVLRVINHFVVNSVLGTFGVVNVR